MRLWTIHPKYLDAKGLVALWREGLLAQKVLSGQTKGYRNHPQLIRFRNQGDPITAVTAYLHGVYQESKQRGYHFNPVKILRSPSQIEIQETLGQLQYEWSHLLKKLQLRDKTRFDQLFKIQKPEPHPVFKLVEGGIQPWEKTVKTMDFKSFQS